MDASKPFNPELAVTSEIGRADADTARDSIDVTLDVGAANVSAFSVSDGKSADTSKSRRCMVELLTGSGHELSDEMDVVVFSRLRIAAMLLFAGTVVFFVYGLLFGATTATRSLATLVTATHLSVTSALALFLVVTHASKPWTGWKLRLGEWLVFGGTALLFFMFTLTMLIDSAAIGFVAKANGPWVVLIFTYALFIPNSWVRALRVIVPMALGPMAATAVAWMMSEPFRDLLLDPRFSDAIPVTFLSSAVSAVIATYGVRTIRTLRAEAHQAKQLGQYRLTRLLGAGGMGEVYEAEHLLLKRRCAIKVIRPEKAGDPNVLKRFEREVRSTARLRHWNTVDIYDYGHTDDGTFYYVMEFLPGINLQQLVERHGPLPEERVNHLIQQVCDALSEAHADGLVHRDIKPANLFLTQLGRQHDVVKVLDFGLVRSVETMPTDIEITQQNVILGSPAYMPPEQASGEAVDPRSDIYALGIVMHYLLTGETPFTGKSALEVIMAHARKSPPPLPSHVSESLAAVVARCLAKEPSQRFQSADDLKCALRHCVAEDQWTWKRANEWWKDNSAEIAAELPEPLENACSA